ncbi:MAG: energy-coupled thiamine transporter ThiT, partial [Clostridia bacterium]|nr:energy-coupled thiamine transporter ThiT [Clostridia bacterium]
VAVIAVISSLVSSVLLFCVFFDYLAPYTVLGLAGMFRFSKRSATFRFITGSFTVTLCRFACHFLSGILIWGQWAPEGMPVWAYSLAYNGAFLGTDFLISLLAGVLLLQSGALKKLFRRLDKKDGV